MKNKAGKRKDKRDEERIRESKVSEKKCIDFY